jgi:septal ring factor EnvC (AmiA/AmiB activator)
MAASGYERYSPILNPYEAQSRRELEQMQFDITPVTQKLQQEQARARGSVSGIQNEAVRQSLLQNTQSEVMGRLQEAMLSGQQQENAYRQARAAGLQSLGSEQRGAREQARAMTTASKAQLQSFVGDMLGSAGQAGQQDLLAATLGSKDFKFASAKDIINKAVSGGVELSVDDLYVLNNPTVPGYEAKVKEINERLAKLPQNKKGGWLNSLKL